MTKTDKGVITSLFVAAMMVVGLSHLAGTARASDSEVLPPPKSKTCWVSSYGVSVCCNSDGCWLEFL